MSGLGTAGQPDATRHQYMCGLRAYDDNKELYAKNCLLSIPYRLSHENSSSSWKVWTIGHVCQSDMFIRLSVQWSISFSL